MRSEMKLPRELLVLLAAITFFAVYVGMLLQSLSLEQVLLQRGLSVEYHSQTFLQFSPRPIVDPWNTLMSLHVSELRRKPPIHTSSSHAKHVSFCKNKLLAAGTSRRLLGSPQSPYKPELTYLMSEGGFSLTMSPCESRAVTSLLLDHLLMTSTFTDKKESSPADCLTLNATKADSLTSISHKLRLLLSAHMSPSPALSNPLQTLNPLQESTSTSLNADVLPQDSNRATAQTATIDLSPHLKHIAELQHPEAQHVLHLLIKVWAAHPPEELQEVLHNSTSRQPTVEPFPTSNPSPPATLGRRLSALLGGPSRNHVETASPTFNTASSSSSSSSISSNISNGNLGSRESSSPANDGNCSSPLGQLLLRDLVKAIERLQGASCRRDASFANNSTAGRTSFSGDATTTSDAGNVASLPYVLLRRLTMVMLHTLYEEASWNKQDAVPVTGNENEQDAVPVTGNENEQDAVPVTGNENKQDAVPVTGNENEQDAVPVTGNENEQDAVPVTGNENEQDAVPVTGNENEQDAVPVTGNENEQDAVPVTGNENKQDAVPVTGNENEQDAVPVTGNENEQDAVPVTGNENEQDAVPVTGNENKQDAVPAAAPIILSFAKALNCSRSSRIATELLHVSKTGGTSLCQLATGYLTKTHFNPYNGISQNCLVPDFQDWVSIVQGSSPSSLTPEDRERICKTIPRDNFTCAQRAELLSKRGIQFYANEMSLHGGSEDPYSAHTCPQFETMLVLREPVARTRSHIFEVHRGYSGRCKAAKMSASCQTVRSNPTAFQECVKLMSSTRQDEVCPPLSTNISEWKEWAPILFDNYFARSLLGRTIRHCRSFGALGAKELSAAALSLSTIDHILMLGEDSINDIVLMGALNWRAGLRSKRWRWSYKMDLTGDLGFPPNIESVLASWNAIDSMLFVWGGAMSSLDAAFHTSAAVLGSSVQLPHSTCVSTLSANLSSSLVRNNVQHGAPQGAKQSATTLANKGTDASKPSLVKDLDAALAKVGLKRTAVRRGSSAVQHITRTSPADRQDKISRWSLSRLRHTSGKNFVWKRPESSDGVVREGAGLLHVDHTHEGHGSFLGSVKPSIPISHQFLPYGIHHMLKNMSSSITSSLLTSSWTDHDVQARNASSEAALLAAATSTAAGTAASGIKLIQHIPADVVKNDAAAFKTSVLDADRSSLNSIGGSDQADRSTSNTSYLGGGRLDQRHDGVKTAELLRTHVMVENDRSFLVNPVSGKPRVGGADFLRQTIDMQALDTGAGGHTAKPASNSKIMPISESRGGRSSGSLTRDKHITSCSMSTAAALGLQYHFSLPMYQPLKGLISVQPSQPHLHVKQKADTTGHQL
ncbi:hypothetical protein CEUSTIGMA_g4472.t1 [Chlamydomonas eustigma]|uniref:Sulfotransferase n=1 Tax=Chlamydomonas eustigma TaxID=1157962 RepID=A0A250X1U3_9CHLO|nr:hypothetical protein CEUSTIGMA_g4472.t1 [Chlamydomonas eustigma]|eukprot:GAX77025.1 hypothetical protein CEUSTIGMA_g4472.t1 [Chlamydomonas eustigma]